MIKIIHQLLGNNIISGGLFIGIIGALIAALKDLPKNLFFLVKKHIISTLTITSENVEFNWISNYLIKTYGPNKFNSIRTNTGKIRSINSKELIKPDFCLGNGSTFLKFKNNLLFVRSFSKDKIEQDISFGEKHELTITKLGRKKDVLIDFINESNKLFHKNAFDSIFVKNFSQYNSWELLCTKPKRTKETVCFSSNLIEDITEDAIKFINNKQWYRDHGLNYRRGYLLYGPPGNGKSTLALYLATILDTDLYIINFKSLKEDFALLSSFGQIPSKSIILIEDIDCMVSNRNSSSEKEINFSTILNSLDGVSAVEDCLIIMTTNNKNNLDSALIRPGRIDRQFEIKNANKDQCIQMLERFFTKVDGYNKLRIEDEFIDEKVSVAKIQEIILSSNNLELAIDNILLEMDSLKEQVIEQEEIRNSL